MTPTLSSRRISTVSQSLRQAIPDLAIKGPESWQVFLRDDAFPVSVALATDFLCFDAPAPAEFALPDSLQWLEWNAALAGNAKFVLRFDPWRLHLRAEIALTDETNLSAVIGGSLHGITDAASRLSGEPPIPRAAVEPATRVDVLSLLRETGWTYRDRPEGAASVEIVTRGDSAKVLIEPDANGLRAAMELACVASQPASCAQALALLLLSAGGALRLARPYAQRGGDECRYGFEVRLGAGCSAQELERALDALAVAAWMCRQEVQCLLDNSMADTYLAIRQLPPLLAREEFCHG